MLCWWLPIEVNFNRYRATHSNKDATRYLNFVTFMVARYSLRSYIFMYNRNATKLCVFFLELSRILGTFRTKKTMDIRKSPKINEQQPWQSVAANVLNAVHN